MTPAEWIVECDFAIAEGRPVIATVSRVARGLSVQWAGRCGPRSMYILEYGHSATTAAWEPNNLRNWIREWHPLADYYAIMYAAPPWQHSSTSTTPS